MARAAKTKAALGASPGLTPLDYMLQVVRDEGMDLAKRLDAAKAAAPYLHPRLTTVKVGNEDDKPFEQVIRWALSQDEATPDPAGGAGRGALPPLHREGTTAKRSGVGE